ncbi:MAG: hypothetical protein Q8L85_00735 [Alphaproteobacteria bacterium]|nr:hypothetical protein [Alphaproteobacteria bacterium]
MSIKNVSFYFCVVCCLIFTHVDAVLHESFFKKKYQFSDPVLNEEKVILELITNQHENAQEVFLLMWEEAHKGNEKIQEKLLYLFSNEKCYERSKNSVPLLEDINKYSIDVLIQIGTEQEKPWTFYQMALHENNLKEKYILLNQALNFGCELISEKLEKDIEEERNNIDINKFFNPINKKTNIKQIEIIVAHCKKYKNGRLLFGFYKKFNSFKYLKAASEIGNISAYLKLGNSCVLDNDSKGAYNWFLKAAKRGHITSMYNVGCILMNDNLIEEGIHWLLKAAEGGDVDAMYLAGYTLKNSLTNSDDLMKAFNLLKEASILGNIKALMYLGEMYLDGFEGVSSNVQEAENCFLNAAESDDPEAMYVYGMMLRDGSFGYQDNDKGKVWIQKSADKEYLPAINRMGEIFWYAINNVSNKKEAFNCFLRAAAKEDLGSMCNVAIMLSNDLGVDKNINEAKKWFNKSIELGCGNSMFRLSDILLKEMVEKNNKETIVGSSNRKLLNKSFNYLTILFEEGYFDEFFNNELADFEKKQPNVKVNNKIDKIIDIRFSFFPTDEEKLNSIYNLGRMCFDKKQYEKAFRFFLCGAQHNKSFCMYLVGCMIKEGFIKGQKADHKKAAEWFLRGAEKDEACAMVELAKLYIFSPDFKNNEQNLKEALFWLRKAASMNEKDACKYLEFFNNLLKENDETDVSDDELIDFIQKNTKIHPYLMNIDGFKSLNKKKEIKVDKLQLDDFEIHVDCTIESLYEDSNDFNTEENIIQIDDQHYKNPKYIREQLRKVGLLKQYQENKESENRILELSNNNKLIVNMLLDKKIKSKNIDYTQLVNLFADPFFENQVSITKSKSGCIIIGKNYKTLDYVVASTHKKHGQTYDGLNPFFAKDLIKILALFSLKAA